MQVHCPTCGALLLADDMSLETLAGKCRRCNSLVDLSPHLPSRQAPARERPRVPTPRRFVVEDTGDSLRIIRRWYGPEIVVGGLFCLFWDGFLVLWYFNAVNQVLAGQRGAWLAICFPVLHLAVGVGLTYSVIAGLLNRTIISVQAGMVTVRHGPVPWFGYFQIATERIDQIFCEQRLGSPGRNSRRSSIDVRIVTKDNEKQTMVSSLGELDEALFIEQQMEAYLGIADRPVPGEAGR
jgi:hypothetical protein